MPLQIVSGDPLLTQAAVLAFGHNAKGRTELDPLSSELMRRYPAAFSMYRRRCRNGRQAPGEMWLWSQTQPGLLFLTVRNSSVGTTRLRHVQQVLLTIARDYRLYNLTTLAIAPIGTALERPEMMPLFETWIATSKLPVVVYEAYEPGVQAAESFA